MSYLNRWGAITRAKIAYLGLGFLLETLLLGGLVLRAVLHEEGEHSLGGVLVERLRELVERGGALETLEQDAALALETHVLGPLDEAANVLPGGEGATEAKGAGALLVERVKLRVGINLGDEKTHKMQP